jgi:site-specific DNA recombinase
MNATCGIYARYSSEKQNANSVEDQIRKCREHATKNGWTVLENHIYRDAAISGASDNRDGLKRMLAAASAHPPAFSCLLVDDSSRLSRSVGDADRIVKELRFAGVKICYVAQGFDSESESAGLLTAVFGGINEQYLVDLGKKTFRGVEGLARRRLHTGGRCFGYKNVPIEHESERDSHGRLVICGVRLEVEPQQAATVLRIFSMYAEGRSLKFITKRLNEERVQSPQPQKGRISRSWCPSSVRTILHNPRYRGLVIWGKTKKVRSPKSGKRVYRPRPENEWVRNEIPEQRIISEELWNKVAARRETVNRLYGDANRHNGLTNVRAMNSAYLFSGILKCADCGASLTILWGKGRNKSTQVYGCPSNWNRGVCQNTARIRRDDLEIAMLSQLQRKILREEVIDYALEKFEFGLLKQLQSIGNEMDRMESRKRDLEGELANLTSALAGGRFSPTIMAAIAEREREISEITERVVSSNEDSIKTRIAAMRTTAKSKLKDLRGVLGGDVMAARTALLNHVDRIQMEADGKVYVAKGTWNLLGQRPTDGAGGQNRTGYARLFRAALYH